MALRALMRVVCLLLVIILSAAQAVAQSRDREPARRSGPGTGNPDEHLVPWRFVQNDASTKERPITLYWMPASLEQAEKSRLMTAETLRVAATRCVDLEIVLPEHVALIQRLGATGKLPTALLVDRVGNVIRRSDNVRGVLAPEAVEKMLSDELSARDEVMYREMIEANQQATTGNNAAAIDLYKKIWDDRCLFPLAGTDAQRALKTLGVIVNEAPATPPVDPNMQTPKKPTASQPPTPVH